MTYMTRILACQGQVMYIPDSKVHGANMGPIWGRQHPGGPHIGPMNFGIWIYSACIAQVESYV